MSTSARSSFGEELNGGATAGSNEGVKGALESAAAARNVPHCDGRLLDVTLGPSWDMSHRSHSHSQIDDKCLDVTLGGAETFPELLPLAALGSAAPASAQVGASALPGASMAEVPLRGRTSPAFGLAQGHQRMRFDIQQLPEQRQPQELGPPPDRPPVGSWACQLGVGSVSPASSSSSPYFWQGFTRNSASCIPEDMPSAELGGEVSPAGFGEPASNLSVWSEAGESPTTALSGKGCTPVTSTCSTAADFGLKRQIPRSSTSVDRDRPMPWLPAPDIDESLMSAGDAEDLSPPASPFTGVEVAKDVLECQVSLPEALPKALPEVLQELLLDSLPTALRGNRAEALAAVRIDSRVMAVVADELRRDKEFVLEAVALSEEDLLLLGPCFQDPGAIFQHAPEELQQDRAFALEVIGKNAFAFAYVPDTFKQDRAFVLEAVVANGLALHHVSAPLREDPEIFLAAARSNRFLLHSTGFPLDNLALILQAINSDGLALEFAPAALKGDRATVLCAVRSNGEALEHASEELRGDRELVLAAVSRDAAALRFASDVLRADREIVCAALRSNPAALEHAAAELRRDREIAVEALRHDPSSRRFLLLDSGLHLHRQDIPEFLVAATALRSPSDDEASFRPCVGSSGARLCF